jgi:CRP-like cAMP-binding protein
LTRSEVAFIPRQSIIDLCFTHPSVGLALWLDTLVDAAVFREWIANVGRRDARARVAHLLCEFGLRHEAAGLGDATHYELPMTQEHLADATALTPVHVNRVLQHLGTDGLISKKRGSITIEDWAALRKVGDFNDAYLHPESAGGQA